jgi:hypothetical protein
LSLAVNDKMASGARSDTLFDSIQSLSRFHPDLGAAQQIR